MTDHFLEPTMIKEAEKLAKSGRLEELERKLIFIRSKISSDKTWLYNLHVSLHNKLKQEYKKLKSDAEQLDDYLAEVAWRSRNLLEITVIIEYVCLNEANAKNFFNDAGEDGMDIINKIELWGNDFKPTKDWIDFNEARKRLNSNARKYDIEDLQGQYTYISIMAKETSLGDHYGLINKVLSKFAHPTAYNILWNPSNIESKSLTQAYFNQGALLFIQAFTSLEKYIETWAAEFEH